ncbi:MAG: site-2 protease family protein [Deltaproteobacteria bacterium]|jgi:Zn-dependent protease|nr:site-2 protease family protein [Deltaproteobacteria bacterium]
MLFGNSVNIPDLIIRIPAILLALTVHEFAHAWLAWKRGDGTAKAMGRITLNPIAHLDVLGTIVMILTGFIGWAKPVPVNPRNFRNANHDMALVAAAGPMANIVLTAIFTAAFWLLLYDADFFDRAIPQGIKIPLINFMTYCVVINIAFAFLNLLPIPPLDGFNVIAMFLPANVVIFCLRYQMLFMIGLILFVAVGPFPDILTSIIRLFFRLLA